MLRWSQGMATGVALLCLLAGCGGTSERQTTNADAGTGGGSGSAGSGGGSGVAGAPLGGAGTGGAGAPSHCPVTWPKRTPDDVSEEVGNDFNVEVPEADAGIVLEVTEAEIAGLWDELGVQLFHVRYLPPVGQGEAPFREIVFSYESTGLTEFFDVVGGFGVDSGLMLDGALYYSYSWGSGIFRSVVGRLRRSSCVLERTESGGYVLPWQTGGVELFLLRAGDGIDVEMGRRVGLNAWENGTWFGMLAASETAIVITDREGNPVDPRFPGG